jgi:CHAT domain-containing protein
MRKWRYWLLALLVAGCCLCGQSARSGSPAPYSWGTPEPVAQSRWSMQSRPIPSQSPPLVGDLGGQRDLGSLEQQAQSARPPTPHKWGTPEPVAQSRWDNLQNPSAPLQSPPLVGDLGGQRDLGRLEQQAQAAYEIQDWQAAIVALQQAIQIYRQQGNGLRQALALSNLALVYQQAGQWLAANQAITDSLTLLQPLGGEPDQQRVLAQALNIQGRLQLAQGQAEAAVRSWEQATRLFHQLADPIGVLQSQLNQAQAFQTLGMSRRAVQQLTQLSQTLPQQAEPVLQATVFRSLGDALQVKGDLPQARQALEQAMQILTQAESATDPATDPSIQPQDTEALAATQLSLANLMRLEATTQLSLSGISSAEAPAMLTRSPRLQNLAEAALFQRQQTAARQFVQQVEAALPLYQQAMQQGRPTTQVQAGLNQLSALVVLQQWSTAANLMPQLRTQLAALPTDQSTVYQRIDLALNWLQVAQQTGSQFNTAAIAELLETALQQATELQDQRAQSFALGSLGRFYQQTQHLTGAQRLTEQALVAAQAIYATDLNYRWQWQLGRLLSQQGQRSEAIAAYSGAVQSLQSLRSDLVAVNRDVQFSFQSEVEPVYRELVDLLLSPAAGATPDPAALLQARQVIEGLQIAELDNFFREACLEAQFTLDRVIDQADLAAAVFYTIVLPDRLEVILKLPQQPLIQYRSAISQRELAAAVDSLLTEVKRPYSSKEFRAQAQQIYDWLIRPAELALQSQPLDTLVFVLDSEFRSLPVATLFDGQQFLIEKYSLALAPGLEIIQPRALQDRRFNVLVAGLSEARLNFSALDFVEQEVADIQAEVPSRVLLNQTFTQNNLQKQLDQTDFSIVHIATHGQFSSNAADTFILAWDRPIDVNQLSEILQIEAIDPEPIELLVLSACRTATGDRRAALGMAGVAVRAGTRSTIASLWSLDDNSGAVLMEQFYQQLVQNRLPKAEALRQAQLALLQNPDYSAPRFWAPYILLGNWL